MAEPAIKPFPEPHFLVCEDVRTEIGGKRFLVGVYPGNDILLRLAVIPTRRGAFRGIVSVLDELGSEIHATEVTADISAPYAPLAVTPYLKFQVETVGTYVVQLRAENEAAIRLGSFKISTRP